MDRWTVDGLKAEGFVGFRTIADLQSTGCGTLPSNAGGVYVVLRCCDTRPSWMTTSCGGHFKDKNPTVSIQDLERAWVCGTPVVYIGKAGGTSSGSMLRARIKAYMNYGMGHPVGHQGGRYIWQLADNKALVICWRGISNGDPRLVESQMLTDFAARFGKLPFANLSG